MSGLLKDEMDYINYIVQDDIDWAFGLTVMSGYAFVSCLRMRARVRKAALLRENIWVCDSVGSPFILGIVRPRIYLSFGMEAEQQPDPERNTVDVPMEEDAANAGKWQLDTGPRVQTADDTCSVNQ